MRLKLCALALVTWASTAAGAPLFPNSVVSNDLDFIRPGDPSAFACVSQTDLGRREMPDKRVDTLFSNDVRVFTAQFRDGTAVELWLHPDLRGADVVEPVAQALGHLPTLMRRQLSHVVIHAGNETAFAEDEGRFFVLYDGNIADRISTRDLQETVFHESVHAAWDVPHASARAWRRAQAEDGAFVTAYAARLPLREDLAETALFAWAMHRTPGRLGRDIEAKLRALVPQRLAYLEALFTSQPLFFRVRDEMPCP
ncbi:MAG: hypothetical protein AAFR93_09255 [Pseudomonadota bacterium]